MCCVIKNLKECIDECGIANNNCNIFMLYQDELESCPKMDGDNIVEKINSALMNCKRNNKDSRKLCEQ